jgi:tetratricopeptide (TPR) repeat protein
LSWRNPTLLSSARIASGFLVALGFFLPLGSQAAADSKALAGVLARADQFLAQDRVDQAAKEANAAEKIAPGTPPVVNLRGVILLRQKQYEDAATQFQRALASDPKFFPAKLNLVDADLLLKKFDEARTALEELQKADPKSELVQFKLALSFVLADEPSRAQIVIDQMQLPGQTPAYYYARAGLLLRQGKTSEAENYFATVKKYYTTEQCAYFGRALAQLGLASAEELTTTPSPTPTPSIKPTPTRKLSPRSTPFVPLPKVTPLPSLPSQKQPQTQ